MPSCTMPLELAVPLVAAVFEGGPLSRRAPRSTDDRGSGGAVERSLAATVPGPTSGAEFEPRRDRSHQEREPTWPETTTTT